MVNTRILEQRLGWRRSATDEAPEPDARPIAHTPVLQGRVTPHPSQPDRRPHRRVAIEEAWESLPLVDADPAALIERSGRAPPLRRESALAAAMDQLRGQVMRTLRQHGWRKVGISSATRGAGRSLVCAALAAGIARLDGVRVLAIDADLEQPGLDALFGVEPPGALGAVLGEGSPVEGQLMRLGPSLAVALNDTPVAAAADLLLSPDAILALRAMSDLLAPDVVLFDMPPMLPANPVAQALLPQLDAVLLVADATRTTAADIVECERLLEGQAPVLAVILNKSEDRPAATRARG